MDGTPRFTAEFIAGLDAVAAAEWDLLAGPDNPFLRHAFLRALEETDCVGAEAGWLPRHLLLRDEAGTLVGAAPAYVKGHSYGEYVFDHGWADAFHRAGGRYYPKLLVGVPFTPVPGPRLLARPGAEAGTIRAALAQALAQDAGRLRLSSIHVTFPHKAEWQALGEAGWLQRLGFQYHWHNRGYASFDDFLGAFASRKRKAVRRERQQAQASGIRLHTLTGADLKPEHWDAFYRFYIDTGSRKWGSPYLNRAFFHRLGEAMAEQVVLVMAEQDGAWVAGALNLRGTDTLYGRNWGTLVDVPFLHFEACYYQAIDFAIAHGLKRVEAGAQGEHKIQRGYLPVPTYSAHWLKDADLKPEHWDAFYRFY
ncbi:MAG TPA: GNAT family N-acetyltransferase, partial [Alphaproteobacteria bacterium]|nr:GNAT family N-acetyltransferase [Alphaproteobacteria bacterium]